MPTFESPEKLQEVLGGFFHHLATHAEIRRKLLESKIIVKFNYREPELSITIDCSGAEPVITYNDAEKKAEVEMMMKADVAHRFWMGEVNLVIALARREVVAKGPIPKILKLLPVIKPAYQIYPKYLQEKGFQAYLIS